MQLTLVAEVLFRKKPGHQVLASLPTTFGLIKPDKGAHRRPQIGLGKEIRNLSPNLLKLSARKPLIAINH